MYFNVRNILPKSGTFPPGHPVYCNETTSHTCKTLSELVQCLTRELGMKGQWVLGFLQCPNRRHAKHCDDRSSSPFVGFCEELGVSFKINFRLYNICVFMPVYHYVRQLEKTGMQVTTESKVGKSRRNKESNNNNNNKKQTSVIKH